MSLEDLGNIGEFVAAVAVIASLVYLAVQIRQNTHSVEASTRHSISRTRNDINLAVAANAELSELLIRGTANYESLQPGERQRYRLYMRAVFNQFDDVYSQYKKGFLTQEFWELERVVLRGLFSEPGLREWWRRSREIFSSDFRGQVEPIIASAEKSTPPTPQAPDKTTTKPETSEEST